MWNINRLFMVVVLICISVVSFCSAETVCCETKAAELVQAVRESENWIHKIDSLCIKIRSTWTRTPEAIAIKRAELKGQFPGMDIDPDRFAELQPVSTGTFEYAIDKTRVRFLDEQPGQRQLKIWDGKQLMAHQACLCDGKEQYYLKSTPQGNFQELLAYETSWPRSQPHSFWWDQRDVGELLSFYGLPEEFLIIGRCNYRGIDCYVLDVSPAVISEMVTGQSYPGCNEDDRVRYGIIGQARGLSGRSYRWYVGVKDNLLRGFVWLTNQEPYIERWMLDYRQVKPGCWFPMSQGQEFYEQDTDGRFYLAFRQDMKVVDIRVNGQLPDELFKLEFKEGVRVDDSRFGRTVRYTYKANPPDLTGKLLPEFEGIHIDSDSVAKNRKMLICFWDMQQRPSRNFIKELVGKAEELKNKSVDVFIIQASKIDEKTLSKWLANYGIPFKVGMLQGDMEKRRFNWGIHSLPWMILTDQDRIVQASGFSLSELEEKI